MGEMLCEIMRPDVEMPLYREGVFRGPFPSGAPAIFINTVARLKHSAGIVGGIGRDDFGKAILERLREAGVDTSLVLESDRGSTGVAFVTYFEDGSRRFLYHFANTPATEPKMPDIVQMVLADGLCGLWKGNHKNYACAREQGNTYLL